MFRILLKKQLLESCRVLYYDAKKGKLRKPLGIAGMVLLYGGLLIGMFSMMFYSLATVLCAPLLMFGYEWLYFSLCAMLAIFIGVCGMIFSAYSSLYQGKDNAILLSMPIRVKDIVDSRLAVIMLFGFLYTLPVTVPFTVVRFMNNAIQPVSMAAPFVLILILPFGCLTLSCLTGWIVAKIAAKVRNKSAVTVVLSLVFIGLYYYVYFGAAQNLQKFVENPQVVAEGVQRYAGLFYVIGQAATGNIPVLLVMTAAAAAAAIVLRMILTRSFVQMAVSTSSISREEYKEKTAVKNSVFIAVFKREFSRFLSSAVYMLNTSMGTIMLVMVAGMAVIRGNAIAELAGEIFGPDGADFVAAMMIVSVCMGVSMNDITSPSVSLEGKNLWISHMIPVKEEDILKAKVLVQLVMTSAPALLCSLCLSYGMKFPAIYWVFAILLPQAVSVLNAEFGLMVGIRNADLHWTNETTVIKQSFSVMLVMLGGVAYTLVSGAMIYFMQGVLETPVLLAILTGVTAVLAFAVHRWNMTKGAEQYRALQY